MGPQTVELRERLQRVEIELQHLREAMTNSMAGSVAGSTAVNNRLTSQYQRIAALDDFKATTLRQISILEAETAETRTFRHEWQKQAARMAVVYEVLKYGGGTIVLAMAYLEQKHPGTLKSLGL